MVFLLYELYDIAEVAIQYGTDFRQNLCTDMLVLAQLGKGGRRHAGSQTQILLFHVFIDQELPQPVITNRHCNTSSPEYALIQINFSMETPFCLSKIQFSDLCFRFQREDFESSGHDEKATEMFRFAPAAISLFMRLNR
jgi:hypothetical protein